MITISILPTSIRDEEKQTDLLIHLPKQTGEIYDDSYYERQKKRLKLEKYTPNPMPVQKPSITDIESEIRELGSLYDKKQTASQVLAEREAVWQELYAFHERIEEEAEAEENRRFQEKHDAAIADINDVINGEDSVVEASLRAAMQQIKLPFDLTAMIDYDKSKGRVSIKATMPLSYCIPTTKTVLHSRGATTKNKLQRELQQEESECIIGLAMLLAGQIFSVSPNIHCVDLLFYKYHSKEALLAMVFDRSIFMANQDKMDVPSVALYKFPFVANIRMVRDAMVLDTISDGDLQAFLFSQT